MRHSIMGSVVPNVCRVPALRLFFPLLRVVTTFLRIISQHVHLTVHADNLCPQLIDQSLFSLVETRILALLFRLILALIKHIELVPQFVSRILLLKVLGELLAATEAVSIAVAVARIHRGAEDFVPGEDVVPDILENTARELVIHAGC